MNRSHLLFFLFCIFFISCNNNKTENTAVPKTEADTTVNTDSSSKVKTIVFFGNSLTAGYGVDPTEAYPALIQNIIDSLKLHYKVINAGVSGETSAGGNGRIEWILRQPVDVFALELGGNDGLRGIPLTETKKNLQAIIDKVKSKYPDAKIMLEGMQIPPNMGQQYATDFKNIYPALASKNNIPILPFLLKDVGGDPKLNQQDGIHP
ncbi:MAG: arylesterase, partial [Ginsengibacter sp.]